ncbi:MAG TPA: xanthine dehydrogenase family protein molybdopterin-binding subunit, partial [Thermoanaerobaculia bacterium]|nr:xanthine dehydrogenase family protein molybdopterin-binding subunit [Thermoanaerobaculia bacterium]
MPNVTPSSKAVGKPIDRVDGRRKVTGTAIYAAEFRPQGLVHAVAVQSTVARGRITSIDTRAAKALPGVLAVLTHENAPPLTKPKTGLGGGRLGESLLPLSGPDVHFAGQYVALVVARRLEEAREAASLVKVSYDMESPRVEIDDASSTATFPEETLGQKLQLRKGDVEAALRAPDLVKLEATYETPAETHNPMELSATVAEWKGDRLTAWDATQAVMGARATLAQVFGVPRENVHVVCPFVGGAFGCKGTQWPHTLLAALAARVVNLPVRLVVTRPQMFTSIGHRSPTRQKITLAASRDGVLRAMRHESTTATSTTTDFVEACGKRSTALLYACENIAVPHRLVKVDVATPTFMRAPGETPGTFALESAMDELAVLLGMDPIELRRRNHADADPMGGKPFSSKHLDECYALGAERFGWARRAPQPGVTREK